MLTETARAAIGLPHPSGRAAMRMLENEGFAFENYVDIFDGGPTMTARTDQVRSIADARDSKLVAIGDDGGKEALVATGHLADFRAAFGKVRETEDGVLLAEDCARALDVRETDHVTHVARL
jgi:arginine N-succinyltransferase